MGTAKVAIHHLDCISRHKYINKIYSLGILNAKKFKKKYADAAVYKEDFAFDVMMVPVDKAIDNEIGEYFK